MSRTMADAAPQSQPWLAPILAAVAGFVDTTGFITLAGVFLAHVTGNFVLLGAAIADADHGSTITKIAVLPLFIGGVVLGWRLQHNSDGRGPRRMALAEAAALALAATIAAAARFGLFSAAIVHPLAIMSGVAAMGIQSMLSRSLKLPMTHVMTGNVTQLTADLLDAKFSGARAGGAVTRSVILVSAFAAGAISAGLLASRFGLMILFLPAIALLAIAAALRTDSSTSSEASMLHAR